MKQRRRIYYSAAQRSEIWDRWQAGEPMRSIGRRFDRESSSVFSVISPTGGIRPPPRRRARKALSLTEREISRGLSRQCSLRLIARQLGRSASTIRGLAQPPVPSPRPPAAAPARGTRMNMPFDRETIRRRFPFDRRLNDGNLGHHGAPPWCSTVIFRRFEKRLILKDFSAIANRWRRGRDSPPRAARAPENPQNKALAKRPTEVCDHCCVPPFWLGRL
jgi:hypothetical protein